MATDYTALDAAILEHIRSGSPWHPMYAGACRTALAHVNPAWVHHPHKIADRLQALRKAGKIRHVKPCPFGAAHGWVIVEPPPMPDPTPTSKALMGQAQRRKLKQFEQRLLTASSYHPNAELYKKEMMRLKASFGKAEWDERMAETQSFLERKREENLELIGDATSPQAVSEVRLLIESKQDPWAYRYPASIEFKIATGCSHVVVTYRDGFLSMLGVSTDE